MSDQAESPWTRERHSFRVGEVPAVDDRQRKGGVDGPVAARGPGSAAHARPRLRPPHDVVISAAATATTTLAHFPPAIGDHSATGSGHFVPSAISSTVPRQGSCRTVRPPFGQTRPRRRRLVEVSSSRTGKHSLRIGNEAIDIEVVDVLAVRVQANPTKQVGFFSAYPSETTGRGAISAPTTL